MTVHANRWSLESKGREPAATLDQTIGPTQNLGGSSLSYRLTAVQTATTYSRGKERVMHLLALSCPDCSPVAFRIYDLTFFVYGMFAMVLGLFDAILHAAFSAI